MRKGADCLSKWVGEGERQLRLLFEQAQKCQPSIIFFDEIDGLAPVRSVKQDQIHASIVSTLLALMDGLDARGQVVVIGATNRPDAIDPALRRPGRFDRELLFPLPSAEGRKSILDIHTAKWLPPLSKDTKAWIVESTVGYCGADIKAFCAEATLVALRRTYPQIYESNQQLQLDTDRLVLRRGDFAAALNKIVPCSQRSNLLVARPLLPSLRPLLQPALDLLISQTKALFPIAKLHKKNSTLLSSDTLQLLATHSTSTSTAPSKVELRRLEKLLLIEETSDEWLACLTDLQDGNDPLIASMIASGDNDITPVTATMSTLLTSSSSSSSLHAPYSNGHTSGSSNSYSSNTNSSALAVVDKSMLYGTSHMTHSPKVLIYGGKGLGQDDLALGLLHHYESLPTITLDLSSLTTDMAYHSPEQALACRIQEAYRLAPAIIYIPNVSHWWHSASEGLRAALFTYTESPLSHVPVLWVSTLVDKDDNYDHSLHEQDGHNSDLHHDDTRLAGLISWLGNKNHAHKGHNSDRSSLFCLSYPTIHQRRQFFEPYLASVMTLPHTIYTAKIKIYTARLQVLQPTIVSLNNNTSTTSDATHHHQGHAHNTNATISNTRTTINTRSNTYTTNNNTLITESHQQLTLLTDEDKQCKREIRTFFRAALSELIREKKCNAFLRPVDPEVITGKI